MAHDEVFAGPVSESVPTSVTGFASRRERANSTASFTYYDDEESPDVSAWQEDEIMENGIEDETDEETFLD